MRLILASASPRRLDLLARIGVKPDAVVPSDIDESVPRGDLPRQHALRLAREKAAARKESKRALQALLEGKALNKADADQPRNFEFAGKIRRVYVTGGQLQQLNRGELGVVMHGGHALVFVRDVALQAQAIAPEAVALLVDPSAPAADDGVPDDLMW